MANLRLFILEKNTDIPIPNATVILNGNKVGVTDLAGFIQFEKTSENKITVSAPGFFSRSITIPGGMFDELKMGLLPTNSTINEKTNEAIETNESKVRNEILNSNKKRNITIAIVIIIALVLFYLLYTKKIKI